MTRHLKLYLLALLLLCFGSSLPAQARSFDLLIPLEEYCQAPLTMGQDLDPFATLMWADPTVSFKTVSGPTWGDCGKFTWKVKWFLQPAPLANESWIVQHYVKKFNVQNCDGTPVKLTDLDYYEAWRMGKNGEAEPKYSYDFKGDGSTSTVDYSSDSASDDDFIEPSRPKTKGTWTRDADAAYQATITAGEFVPKSVGEAGILPATTNKPTGFGTVTIHRHAEATWDCCAATKTSSGSASANNPDNTYTESWTWDGTTTTHKLNGKVVALLPVPTTDTPLSALAALVHSSPAWDGTTFDPGQLISVANQLQAMGSAGAFQALHAYRDELANAPGDQVMNSTRIGLLIRVLFLAPGFPRMQVGQGDLPDDVAASYPLYPLALNQDVPLLVDSSFSLTGKAEDPLVQIQFCEQQCTLRSTPLMPTPAPTPSPTPMPTPSPTPMPTPSPTPMPTPSPTPSPTPMPTPSPTPMPNLSTVAWQIPSMSAEPRNASLLQAQLLRLAKNVCVVPGAENPELFLNPGLPRMLEKCMSVFQSGGAVWDHVTNTYKHR